MAEYAIDERGADELPNPLTRTIDLTRVSVSAVAWVVITVIGAALRLFQIGASSLSADESRKAFDAWSLIHGATEGPNRAPDETAPTGLLLRAASFFLFGDSDTTVRVVSALLGIGLILLIWSIRDLLGDLRALAAAALIALSPTLVYASRTVNEEIVALFMGTALIVSVFRLGQGDRTPGLALPVIFGATLAALIGSGPSAITLLVVIVATGVIAPFVSSSYGTVLRTALDRLMNDRRAFIAAVSSFVITLVTLFSRFFSDPGALGGLGQVLADWGSLIATRSSATPTQFFILSLLLYEILAVVFAFKAAIAEPRPDEIRPPIDWSIPAIWFLLALVLFSFSSGRETEHAALIVFPLLLLGGIGLGDTLRAVLDRGDGRRNLGVLILTVLGLTVALLAALVLIGRIDTAADKGDAVFQVFAAALIALAPMVVLAYTYSDHLGKAVGWRPVRAAVLLGVAIVIALLSLRTATELSFYRNSEGNELLAQQTSTEDLRDITGRIANLSRDVNGVENSPANPTGGLELSIRMDRTVQWPFRWYFRDYPNLTVTAPGQATNEEAQLVIASDPTGMTEAGYQPSVIETTTGISPTYRDPSLGTVLKHIFLPSNWDQGVKFLLYRDMVEPAAPGTVVFGYAGEVVSEISGERPTYSLFDRAGPGANSGQFNQPRGIAISPDGLRIYVLDTQNGRIQVFADTGELLGIWGDGEGDDVSLALTENGLGPYGLSVGPDGLIYVADTWNHRIVVINPDGQVVRTFGEFGNNEDSPDPNLNPGTFYGPRDVVVFNDEIYVTDTGNERVQVFGPDGSFRRAWGGTGTGPGQLIEPVGIAVSDDSRVYVADSGNGRISVFDTNGAPLAQWPVDSWLGTQFFEPYLVTDSAGNIYASSPNTSSVLVYAPDGALIDEIVEIEGVGIDRVPLQLPAGLAISSENDLLIADRGSSEVYLVDLASSEDGAETITDLAGDGASPTASPEGSPVESPDGSPIAG